MTQPPSVDSWVNKLEEFAASNPEVPEAVPAIAPVTQSEPAAEPKPTKPPEPVVSKVEPAKPVETAKPAEPPKQPEAEDKMPRTSQEWKKYRENQQKILAEKKEVADALAKAQQEIESLRKAEPKVPEDYERLKRERDEYDAALRQTKLENHPRFKAYYDGQIDSAIKVAESVVDPDKAKEVAKLLQSPNSEFRDSKLDELLSELPPIKQGRLQRAIDKVEELRAERQAQIAKSAELYETVTKQESEATAKQAQQQIEQTTKFIESQFDRLSVDPQFKVGETALLSPEDKNVLKNLLIGGPSTVQEAEQRVRMVAQGLAYVPLLKTMIADKERIKQLESQLAGLTAAEPRKGDSADAKTTREKPKAGARPDDIIDNWMGGLLASTQP